MNTKHYARSDRKKIKRAARKFSKEIGTGRLAERRSRVLDKLIHRIKCANESVTMDPDLARYMSTLKFTETPGTINASDIWHGQSRDTDS